MNLKLIPD